VYFELVISSTRNNSKKPKEKQAFYYAYTYVFFFSAIHPYKNTIWRTSKI